MSGKDDAFVEKFESLARRVLDDADVAALRDAVFALPEPGSLQQVLASLRLGPARLRFTRGSAGALSAWTTMGLRRSCSFTGLGSGREGCPRSRGHSAQDFGSFAEMTAPRGIRPRCDAGRRAGRAP